MYLSLSQTECQPEIHLLVQLGTCLNYGRNLGILHSSSAIMLQPRSSRNAVICVRILCANVTSQTGGSTHRELTMSCEYLANKENDRSCIPSRTVAMRVLFWSQWQPRRCHGTKYTISGCSLQGIQFENGWEISRLFRNYVPCEMFCLGLFWCQEQNPVHDTAPKNSAPDSKMEEIWTP